MNPKKWWLVNIENTSYSLYFFLLLCRVRPTNRKTQNCYSKTAAFASHSYYSRCWDHSSFQRLWSTKYIIWGSFCFITGKNKTNLSVKCSFFIPWTPFFQLWTVSIKTWKGSLFSLLFSLYQLGVLKVIWFKNRFNSMFVFCLLSLVCFFFCGP